MSGWGDMVRAKMKRNVDFSMKMRRIRRAWYHFTDDTADNVAGMVCLFFALVICAMAWLSLDQLLRLFR